MGRHTLTDSQKLRQIESIAAAEPFGSPMFFVHVGLLSVGGIGAVVLYQAHWFMGMVFAYIAALTLEKVMSLRAYERQEAQHYTLVLGLLTLRALMYSGLVISVWMVDNDVFKLAALALLIAATINIFVFHATYPQIMACVAGPMWFNFAAVAALHLFEHGVTPESVAVAAIALCVTPYFYLALLKARTDWLAFDATRIALSHSQKQDTLGKLVSGVAHDFNNVLAVTLGTAELLKTAKGPEREKLVDQIIKEAEKGAALSHQLLAFSRQSDLTPAAHRVEDIFEEVSTMLARLLPMSISTAVVIPPQISDIFVDRHQLETAILNLAINARDAMPRGGRIVMRAREVDTGREALIRDDVPLEGQFICISVTDTGHGVEAGQITKVFDPFYTTKAPGEGSGLGLSMVQGFAAQSGGIARFESQPGHGSVVSLFLPAAHASAVVHPVAKDDPFELVNTGANVLLVEDEAALRQVVAMQLQGAGYAVTSAQNGDDAQALLNSGLKPDILITDLVMPGAIQGIQLAQTVEKTFKGIPVILVSGYPDEALSTGAFEGQAPVFLQKPVSRSVLLRAVQNALLDPGRRLPV